MVFYRYIYTIYKIPCRYPQNVVDNSLVKYTSDMCEDNIYTQVSQRSVVQMICFCRYAFFFCWNQFISPLTIYWVFVPDTMRLGQWCYSARRGEECLHLNLWYIGNSVSVCFNTVGFFGGSYKWNRLRRTSVYSSATWQGFTSTIFSAIPHLFFPCLSISLKLLDLPYFHFLFCTPLAISSVGILIWW